LKGMLIIFLEKLVLFRIIYAMKYAKGKKKVLSVHGVFSEQVDTLHSKSISSVAKIAESQVLKWPDKLTTDSRATQKLYKEKFDLNFEYLPSPLDIQKFSSISDVPKIENQIRDQLNKIPGKPVIFESFQLRDIVLPPRIKAQIERVQIAKQEAVRAKYEVLRAQQEAQKEAAIAQGKANAAKIEAQGKAEAKLIEAQAQAKANKLISGSLTKELLKLKQIEVQNKFNEALKNNPNAKIFLTPGGAVPNIWMNVEDKKVISNANKN